MSKVSVEELSKHDKVDDLWVAINGKVYDFTQFAPEHPGTSCQKSKKALFHDVYAFSRSSLSISINTSLLKAHTIQCYNHEILHTHTHTHSFRHDDRWRSSGIGAGRRRRYRSVRARASGVYYEAYDGIESVEGIVSRNVGWKGAFQA